MVAGDTCLVRAGAYRETVTPRHSGTASAPITFRPYKSDRVTVTGTDLVTEWRRYRGHIYHARTRANPHLWADQVFVDSTMMNPAGWPDPGRDLMHPLNATAGVSTTATMICDPHLAVFPIGFWTGAIVHIQSGYGWYANTATIARSGPSKTGGCPASSGYVSFPRLAAIAGDPSEPWAYDPIVGNPYRLVVTQSRAAALRVMRPGQSFYRGGYLYLWYLWTPGRYESRGPCRRHERARPRLRPQ